FKSKDDLFRTVVAYYSSTYLNFMNEALLKPTALAVAEAILFGCVEAYTSPGHPPGCLIVNNSMPCAQGSIEIRRELASARKSRIAQLRKRFRQAKASGDLPPNSDPDDLARYLMTLRWGMAIEAQSGATKRELSQTATRALEAWPGGKP